MQGDLDDEEMDEVPDWYWTLRAADRLNCSAIELERSPSFWRKRALVAITAESQAGALVDERQRKLRELGF